MSVMIAMNRCHSDPVRGHWKQGGMIQMLLPNRYSPPRMTTTRTLAATILVIFNFGSFPVTPAVFEITTILIRFFPQTACKSGLAKSLRMSLSGDLSTLSTLATHRQLAEPNAEE